MQRELESARLTVVPWDAPFEILKTLHVPFSDIVAALGRPQVGDLLTTSAGVGFVPHGNVTVSKAFQVVHDALHRGCWALTMRTSRLRVDDAAGQKMTAVAG